MSTACQTSKNADVPKKLIDFATRVESRAFQNVDKHARIGYRGPKK